MTFKHLYAYFKKIGSKPLSLEALHSLPQGYAISAADVAALSGYNQIKGIHPIFQEGFQGVVILCTLHGKNYSNEWLSDDHTILKYYWEGHIDPKTGKKSFNPRLKTNQTVMESRTKGFPLYVFTRPKSNELFHYAGEFVFQTSSTDDNGTYFELILDSTQTTIREEELLETAVPEGLTTREGRQIQRQHLTRERDPKIVKQAKKLALTHNHRLMCKACGFDFLSSLWPSRRWVHRGPS